MNNSINAPRKTILLLAFLFTWANAFSQNDILNELHKIQDSYKENLYLSYDLSYSVASTEKPDSNYYSGKGSFKISQSNYWGKMDDVEYMQNAQYSIAVIKEKKLIHVSVARGLYPQLISLVSFDSLIRTNHVKYVLSTTGTDKLLTFDFSETTGFEYKNFKIAYDPVTYNFKQISYTLPDQVTEEEGKGDGEKLMVFKAVFTNYSTQPFGTEIFNENNYFHLVGKDYVPQNTYNEFEVFVASQELIKK